MIENPFGLGAHTIPDYRDIPLTAAVSLPDELPSSYFVDISKLPIWNQGKLPSCVGHAFAKYKQKLDLDDTGVVVNLSPRFLYAYSKCTDGFSGGGTLTRNVAKILKTTGCSTELTVPNDVNLDHETYVYQRTVANMPPNSFSEAVKFKTSGYAYADVSVDGLKHAIIAGNGAALLMNIGEEWWTDKKGNSSWTPQAILPLRAPRQIVSGHEVYLYGYEDTFADTKFYILNSFSAEWGDKGTGWFYWSEQKNFIREAITIVDIPNKVLEETHNLPPVFKYHFTTNMNFGDQNEEVQALQRALKLEGLFNFAVTGYYGDITKKAVLAFQLKYNLPLSFFERYILGGSRVGPKTLSQLNLLYSG